MKTTKRDRLIKTCMIKELKGKPIPRGNSLKARRERCILKVKCQGKINPKAKKVNPFAVCNASVY